VNQQRDDVGVAVEPVDAFSTAEAGQVLINADTPDDMQPSGVDELDSEIRVCEPLEGRIALEATVAAPGDDDPLSIGIRANLDPDDADELAGALQRAADAARDNGGGSD
jgi:hypothetical protein